MTTPSDRIRRLFYALNIESGDVVYLHTSFGRLRHLGLTADQLIESFLDRLGERGTLVMPSFSWNLDRAERPWKGYEQYFLTRPTFDVCSTPANIGWIPERFRSLSGVRRSLDYWWSVCAYGRLAHELTHGQERVPHPYGAGSTFDLLRLSNAKIVGLGVTLNTTSLAPVADYAFGSDHPHQVFTDEAQSGCIIDYSGRCFETMSIWLLPEVVKSIKPSVVLTSHAVPQVSLHRADEGEVIQFAYDYETYHAAALQLGRTAITSGRPLPWLAEYPQRRNVRCA